METLEEQKYVSSSLQQLLLGELLPVSIRLTDRLRKGAMPVQEKESEETEVEQTRISSKLSHVGGDIPGSVKVLDSELRNDDEVTVRVELFGYDLGFRIAEVLLLKSNIGNKDAGGGARQFADVLEIMKFICRDVWSALYGKQVDNLRTNHRGTFVLVDSNFRMVSDMISDRGMNDTVSKSLVYLYLPCGIVRGILMNFGIEAEVRAEFNQFPSVTFNILTSVNN